jgi:glycosyltransferase involved in cell wall biosynthesis
VNLEQTTEYRITIVVPFHKLEGTEQFFRWICELNKYKSIKVIVVIDSDDRNIFERLSNLKFKNLQLITKKVGAPGLARNLALANLVSEYVMFADSDDFVYLDSVLRILDKPRDSNLIVASYEKFNMKTKKVTKHKYPTNMIEFAVEPALWRIIFKCSEIKDLNFTHFRMAEDQIFILHYFRNEKTITSTGEIVYRYLTHHKDQITNQESALKELGHAIEYLDLNVQLTSTSIGSYVYAKLHFSLGLNGIKKLYLQRFPISKLLEVLSSSMKMKIRCSFDTKKEFDWSNNE